MPATSYRATVPFPCSPKRIARVFASGENARESTRTEPIRRPTADGGEETVGYVDLVSERAYRYKPGEASDLVKLPDDFWENERATRMGLVEKLADHDDALLEQLLEDVEPSKEEIYRHLAMDLSRDLIVPVLVGAAQLDHGVRRLLKARWAASWIR